MTRCPSGLDQETLATLCRFFADYPELNQVTLFGSRAMGTFKPYSDIDLALHGIRDASGLARFRGDLEELALPYKFDIVAYDAIQFVPLLAHIKRFGRQIYPPPTSHQSTDSD